MKGGNRLTASASNSSTRIKHGVSTMGSCEKAGAHLVKIESEKENDFSLNTFVQIPIGQIKPRGVDWTLRK